MLRGKEIVLGVTGGIAAYKAVELLRLLTKSGANVHVVMTRAATEFVGPLTFQTLSMNPIHTDLFNLISEKDIGHISLADRADLFIIAPATANVIGKVAAGIADDLLTTTIMATKAPVLFAPAMNVNMYQNPIYRQNEEKLASLGFHFVAPVRGMLACGWEGEGKLPDPQVIFEAAESILSCKDLVGERMLITAGPTREELDPIRFISNYSSGKMGYALAKAARRRGADVVLVSGPTALPEPAGIDTIQVTSALEMSAAVMERLAASSIVIKTAAVADFRPVIRAGQKIKKDVAAPVIELVKNPDILAEIGKVKSKNCFVIGFAAETANLIDNARKKLEEKNVDMMVANDVSQEGAGFNVDTNIVKLVYRNGGVDELPMLDKSALADVILDKVLEQRKKR
jgi:phosphopantothenoylcysteine decarboxylase/phosphopantothenate--cysteine ligase